MSRKPYAEDEIILCTYIAIYGPGLLVEKKVASFGKRSEGSVKMKVQNIVAMLDDKGIDRHPSISALSGVTAGDSGRETDWAQVQILAGLEKAELWGMCKEILASSR